MNFRYAVMVAFVSGAIALGAQTAKADAIVFGVPTFSAGNENISSTLAILDAANPNIVYLGSYLGDSPGWVAKPKGEKISGTGGSGATTGTLTASDATSTYNILYYDVKAGDASDLIDLSDPASTVDWTTDWTNLLTVNGKAPHVSRIDVFGVDPPVPVPEPSSLMLLVSGLVALGSLRWKHKTS